MIKLIWWIVLAIIAIDLGILFLWIGIIGFGELRETYYRVLPFNTHQIIKSAIEKFGIDNQKVVAIEELSELQKEICKDLRGIGNRESIVEELGDVQIMAEQVKKIYNITEEELLSAKEYKLKRLEKRIEE